MYSFTVLSAKVCRVGKVADLDSGYMCMYMSVYIGICVYDFFVMF